MNILWNTIKVISKVIWALLMGWGMLFSIASVGYVMDQYIFPTGMPIELTFDYFFSIFIKGLCACYVLFIVAYIVAMVADLILNKNGHEE